ncbi:MAG: hypothetical protein AAB470_02465 [Patescibacteria group bacterium]
MQINQKGFTLIETLFYTAGLVLLIGAMITFMFYMFNWYNNVTIVPRVDRVGVNLVDKIIKDIRSGTLTNLAQSSLNTTNGTLSINANVNGVIVTKYFAINNNRLIYQVDGGTISYITPADMTISRFYITSDSTPVSQAVHFDIDINFNTRGGQQTKTYSGLAVLRQSY